MRQVAVAVLVTSLVTVICMLDTADGFMKKEKDIEWEMVPVKKEPCHCKPKIVYQKIPYPVIEKIKIPVHHHHVVIKKKEKKKKPPKKPKPKKPKKKKPKKKENKYKKMYKDYKKMMKEAMKEMKKHMKEMEKKEKEKEEKMKEMKPMMMHDSVPDMPPMDYANWMRRR